VCGTWPDGSQKAVYVKKHHAVGDQWIMERWLPAEEYAKCSKDAWDRDLLILGPWPERGEYEVCHVFEAAPPDACNIETLVCLVEKSRAVSFYDTQVHVRNQAAKEKKAIGDQQEAMIRNWLPAFGTRPVSGYGGSSSRKTMPILKSANELGLPTQGGQIRTRHPQGPLGGSPRPKFQVSLT
jgi:hypothetical protein